VAFAARRQPLALIALRLKDQVFGLNQDVVFFFFLLFFFVI